MRRLFRFIIFLIFAAPITMAAYAQLFGAAATGYMAWQMQEAINPSDPLKGKIKVANAKERRFRLGYQALGSLDEFTMSRNVSYTEYVYIRDFLKPGEQLPARDLRTTFAKARAGKRAQEECRRIQGVFAKKCVVKGTSVSDIGKGYYRISAVLGFTQKDPLGSINPQRTYHYHEVKTGDARNRKSTRIVARSAAMRTRMQIYRETQKACRTLRAREGTCAIYRLSISARRHNHTMLSMRPRAVFSVLQ